MSDWFSTALLAVEEAGVAAPGGAPAGGAANSGGPSSGFMLLIVGGMAAFMLITSLFGNNPRKQAAQQLEKLKGLKKNDPVVTIGGIRGNFVSLSEDGTEVTLQLNDNMRVRFDASAIRAVPPAAPPPAKS